MRLILRCLGLSVVALLVMTSGVKAQLNWARISTPDTTSLFSIDVEGNLYLASGQQVTNRRLYYSNDRGSNWSKIYSGRIDCLACDSNGAVIVLSDSIRYSLNHGSSWVTLSSTVEGISSNGRLECSKDAIYLIAGASTTFYRNVSYQPNWSAGKFYPYQELFDLRGLWCGPSDRVIVGLNVESSWILLDSFHLVHDTACSTSRYITDNSPPRSVTFGKDGFLYMEWFGVERLSPGSLQWDCYDTMLQYDAPHHFPLTSADAFHLISADTSGTWESSNHGNDWVRIGSSPPMGYSVYLVAFDSKSHGYALTDSGLFQTNFFSSVKSTQGGSLRLIELFPNPCTNELSIQSHGIISITIFDAIGRIRMNSHLTGFVNQSTFDVSDLSPGTYYIIIKNDGQPLSATFIKE